MVANKSRMTKEGYQLLSNNALMVQNSGHSFWSVSSQSTALLAVLELSFSIVLKIMQWLIFDIALEKDRWDDKEVAHSF